MNSKSKRTNFENVIIRIVAFCANISCVKTALELHTQYSELHCNITSRPVSPPPNFIPHLRILYFQVK